MTEYTAAFVRALIEEIEPTRVEDPGEQILWTAVETLEGMEGLLTRLPAAERRGALSGVALERDGVLWFPTARNCRLSAGVAVKPDGFVSFAVGNESSTDEALVAHFSARAAAVHTLRSTEYRDSKNETEGDAPNPEETLVAESVDPLVDTLKTSGWAVPVGRRVGDLSPELLARMVRLSEDGVAHLFAEDGGLVLAMAGSTAGDRRKAVERLPRSPGRPLASRSVFGVLLDAGGAGSHYSEQEGWGLAGKADKAAPGRELEAAAERFRAARAGGSLAVAETKAERRRIEANRRRQRAEFVARRRRGEELVVRSSREIDASREESREVHWTDDPGLGRRTERARKSGRAAYDTARAVYLGQLPSLAHRLLHLLRREGDAVREKEFIPRRAKLAGAKTSDPEAALKTALRALADAGKVRRIRSRKTGEVFVTAAEPLDRERFRRSLNGLIRDATFGIVSPWTEASGVEPGDEEDEEALLECDPEDVSLEETGREAFLDRVADGGAQEEIEALTA